MRPALPHSILIIPAEQFENCSAFLLQTFHSLEDRIVKKAFKELECDCICDKSLPVCVCGKKKEIEIITKHPITASEEELNENSRAKSAKLRIAQKI